MTDLLRRYTRMPVFQAEDGMKVKSDSVYVIPPNKDMSILHGKLQLLEPKETRGLRHPIDSFFRSLAEDRGEKSVCIVLSGTGSEGTLGLRAVKGQGGLVIVQDPGTAKYDGMPASAVATGLADFVLPPEEMPGQLLRYVKHAHAIPGKPVDKPEVRQPDLLQKIFVIVRSQTGNDFSLYKQNTVMRRIERRMAIHQIEHLAEYVTFLRSNPHEVGELFKELLIRVTNFFRDPEAFKALASKVLPHIFKGSSPNTPVRVWVPGCSTGEEAYSLAIVFHEYMQQMKGSHKVQILATDVDGGAIETARVGVYPESITFDVSVDRLARFFYKKGNSFKVRDEIREMVVFAVQNIIKDPPFSRLDMISCRNLLIYLGLPLQKRVIPLFRYALKTDGILFLGSSETIGDNTDLFSAVDKKWKVYQARKQEVPLVLPADMRRQIPVEPGTGLAAGFAEQQRIGKLNIGEMTQKTLLDRYTPPCAVVNNKGDILFLHGRNRPPLTGFVIIKGDPVINS
jgi:two-component system CheB/CheR fusion protein